MDITPNSNTNTTIPTPNTNTNNLTIKTTLESDFDISPSKIHLSKPLSFTNGVVLKHNNSVKPNIPVVVNYKECLKNHAASLGGHALDGCGEFMPSPSAVPTDPTSLKCAACGCHRNFHRRDPDDSSLSLTPKNTFIEYQPHHRHRPPPPDSPSSMSPPPISSSYPPSAPHMLLALSDGLLGPQNNNHHHSAPIAHIRAHPNGRKRFRTKFSQQQKEKMFGFAERVGWKIQKRDEQDIINFCSEIGVDRSVLKVWMHNNKSTLGKRDNNNIINNNVNGNTNYNVNNNGGGGNLVQQEQLNNIHHSDSTGSPLVGGVHVTTNGNVSSSSS